MEIKLLSRVSMLILLFNLTVSFFVFPELFSISPSIGILVLSFVGIVLSLAGYFKASDKNKFKVMILLHVIGASVPMFIYLYGHLVF
ncbi:hypothetical protein [Pseudalkalibacillus sp. SCS-8]|uniref:hypothetical protein n=1 Tax=Pseudalkalibacillus nanhaiensis TaxID=3115291 RepID=UPI0032DB02AF